MLLVACCQILRHQNDVPYLPSIDLCLGSSINLVLRHVVWLEDLHVLDEISLDLRSIVAAEVAESHDVADPRLENFVDTDYHVSC